MIFKALRAEGRDPAANLALEEALLSLPAEEDPLLLLYVNDPCIVVGRNQNPWAEVAPRSGLPIFRRISGGGAVYHDRGNLNWALLVPRRLHDQEAELAVVSGALRALGFAVEPGLRGGLYLDGGSDFAGGKVSGTARRFGAHRVLHHGTLLVDADLERLATCLGGLRFASSRAVVSVPGRPVNLGSLHRGLGVDELATALVGSMASAGHAASAEAERAESFMAAAGRAEVARDARERHRSWDWIWGQTPDFSMTASTLAGEVRIDVKSGRVERVEGPGWERFESILGSRFEYDLPKAVARAGD
ncbi:MAG: biotin/lipoate A/B protein ligase family protein [Rectinemataceae bacterium]